MEFVDILPTLVEAASLPQLDLCPEFSRNVSLCRKLSYYLQTYLPLPSCVCREGMSAVRLAEGGEWKDAIFWQQPRGYWTPKTKNYQGDYRAAAAQTQQILVRLHREDGPVALLRVCQPDRRGHAGAELS